MERLTTELTLPNCGARVVCYNKLTHFQSRELQKVVLGELGVDIDLVSKKEKMPETLRMNASLKFQMEDMAVGFLIKEVFLSDGTKVEDITGFYRDLDVDDGTFLIEKINEMTTASQLSAEAKKK